MRIEQQIEFITEIDKLKGTLRQSLLCNGSRRENSAEHSWHLAVMAALLLEHAAAPVNQLRVLKMLLLHDIVEIDAGDTYAYDPAGNETRALRERQAAERLFGILPADQAAEFRLLWDEFEAEQTPDATFAAAVDRLQPLLLNFRSGGKTWMKYGIGSAQVLERMRPIQTAAPSLWPVVLRLVTEAQRNGWLVTSDVA